MPRFRVHLKTSAIITLDVEAATFRAAAEKASKTDLLLAFRHEKRVKGVPLSIAYDETGSCEFEVVLLDGHDIHYNRAQFFVDYLFPELPCNKASRVTKIKTTMYGDVRHVAEIGDDVGEK